MALVAGLIFAFTLLHIFSFYPHKATAPADCAVVFGAAVWPTDFGPTASHALSDRTLAAAELYKDGLTNCIVLSGADSIYGAHEVDIMTDILFEQEVPLVVLELDREGVNTLATIENLSKERSYILISNDFHLARIGLLAQRAGLGASLQARPHDTSVGTHQGFTLHAAQYQSGGRYIKEYYFVFREAVALWYYFFTTLIKL